MNEMVVVSPNLSITTSNVNGFNSTITGHRVGDKITRPSYIMSISDLLQL